MDHNPHWIKVYVSTSPVGGSASPLHEAGLKPVGAWGSPPDSLIPMAASVEEFGMGLGPARATPLVDIHDRHDSLVLEADLPGVVEEDIVVELKQNVLKLMAKVRRPELEGARPLALESTVSVYERSFILSDEFDRDAISADYHAGVLTLTLPRNKRVASRRIAVNPRTKRTEGSQ